MNFLAKLLFSSIEVQICPWVNHFVQEDVIFLLTRPESIKQIQLLGKCVDENGGWGSSSEDVTSRRKEHHWEWQPGSTSPAVTPSSHSRKRSSCLPQENIKVSFFISISVNTSPYSYFISSQRRVWASEIPSMLVIMNFSGTFIHQLSYFSYWFTLSTTNLFKVSHLYKNVFWSYHPFGPQANLPPFLKITSLNSFFCIDFSLIYS